MTENRAPPIRKRASATAAWAGHAEPRPRQSRTTRASLHTKIVAGLAARDDEPEEVSENPMPSP